MKREKIQELIEAEAADRKFLDPVKLENTHHEIVKKTHRVIKEMVELNHLEALCEGDKFSDFEKMFRGKHNPDRTSLRAVVQIRGNGSVTCDWRIAKIVRVDDRWRVFSNAIRRLSNGNYSKRIFDRNPEWVQILGPEIEDQFRIIRRRNTILAAIRELLYEYDRLSKKLYDTNPASTYREELRQEITNGKNLNKILSQENL